MKKCPYCGAEYPDDVVACAIDQTPFEVSKPAPPAPPPEPDRPRYLFTPLSAADWQQDWVTLVSCGTLVAADLVVARLRAAGIASFLPDEFLMQTVGWNFNTYGYVRVQVPPGDYAAAKVLLGAMDKVG